MHDRLTPVERGVGRLGLGEAVVRAGALELPDEQGRAVVAVPGGMPAGGEVAQELLVEKVGRGRGLLIGAHRCLLATSWRMHGPGIVIDRPGTVTGYGTARALDAHQPRSITKGAQQRLRTPQSEALASRRQQMMASARPRKASWTSPRIAQRIRSRRNQC